MIDLPVKVTRELLLEKNSEETYLSYYTGLPVRKGTFKSPFRQDRHPSCGFFRSHTGRLYLADYARPEYTADFIQAAMFRYCLDYNEALKAIAQDFGIIKKHGVRTIVKPVLSEKFETSSITDIRVAITDFNDRHLEFWNSFGITKDTLKRYKVFPLSEVFVNNKIIYNSSRSEYMAFGYYHGSEKVDNKYYERWKVYFPGNKKMRFVSNWKKEWLQGLQQLPENGKLLVITKSMKDVMAMREFGLNAVAPNSENQFVPDDILDGLSKRFKHTVIIYDNDAAGIRNMARIRRQYNDYCYMWIPKEYEAKDFSDFVQKYGREFTEKSIVKAKEYLKRYLMAVYSRNHCNQDELSKNFFTSNGESTIRDSQE